MKIGCLTVKNTETNACLNIENSSIICCYRGEITVRAIEMGAVNYSNLDSEIIFTSEKKMYEFISKLSKFCKDI